jgi:1,4-dihydroxy-2-naphthoate polyprenyltransferase
MNGSDIETSSKRGVRIAETAGTGASSHRGSAGERDTVGEHVSSLKDPMDSPAVTPVTDIPLRERLLAWKEILETANPPVSRPLDTVGKWLVITRAAVFPMTIWSGLIGGLLAVEANRVSGGAPVDWGLFLLAVVGLVLAHAANNMINDYFDTTGGVDTEGYVRALYAPHPILSGWVTKRQLEVAILVVNAIGAAIMLGLAAVRGPLIIVFALAGLFVSVFYVAPPIRLKHHGLGEPGVFLVWGPLMVGGTFLAATGTIAPWVLLVSVPYALLVTSVLFGKHIDKIEADTKLGVRTLPVILGDARARVVGQWLMILFYPLTLLAVLAGWIGPWVMLVVLGIPRLMTVLAVFRPPKPAGPPPGRERVWPLWFVGAAFVHTRRAGGLLTLGLLLNALLPIRLPLPWQ